MVHPETNPLGLASLWCGPKRPLISNVSVDEIANLPEEWPLAEKRWPIPRVPEIAADPVVAAAYARLARRSEQSLVYAAEVLTIVGGAWLGTTLLNMWKRFDELHDQIVVHLERADALGLTLQIYTDLDLWLTLLPAIPIMGGITLRARANLYTDARTIYELTASSVTSDNPTSRPSLEDDARVGLMTFIRRLIH